MQNIKYYSREALGLLSQADLVAYTPAAFQLLVGTAAVESGGIAVRQYGSGPACGYWQMEPATADDIFDNWLRYRVRIAEFVKRIQGSQTREYALTFNPLYAAIMARLHYRRVRDPLPAENDFAGLAEYWKVHYNTEQGKGDPAEMESWLNRLFI